MTQAGFIQPAFNDRVGRLPLKRGTFKGFEMHYRNGREANNGDKVVRLEGGVIVAHGTLQHAVAGNDYCNGDIAYEGGGGATTYACLCDCLHIDDVAEMLAENGMDKRPEGK